MTYHEHLAYLQQVSDLVESHSKPLAARLGFIAKKICAKHTVHISGLDAPKLRKCKACYAPITVDDIKFQDKQLLVKCSLCGIQRRYGQKISSRKSTRRTKEEKKPKRRRRKKKERRNRKGQSHGSSQALVSSIQ